jgi:hypothetical protein
MANVEIELYRQIAPDKAAEFLDVSTRKLEKMRQEGDGPRYVRVSRRCIRYRIKDLVEYQEAHLKTNTIYEHGDLEDPDSDEFDDSEDEDGTINHGIDRA